MANKVNGMQHTTNRRRFLAASAALGAAGAAPAAPAARGYHSDIYAKVGVRPLINGVGTVTVLGGSIMPPEVVGAMEEASRHFVPMLELQEKVGARIAELIGVPAAMVTCGAASAIQVAAAACVARGNPEFLRRLPDTSGMKNEIVQQKSHRSGYEAQMLQCGTKIVWVETRQELDRAINDRTAMMFFLNKADPDGRIKRAEWIRVGKERGVPTFNDAAADVPPVGNLSLYVKEGFDLVTFSGGKGLFGPQASGILMGSEELVAAGRKAISPHGGIGRGMKVGKEEMMGLLAAVERYVRLDHAAERRVLDGRAAHVLKALEKVKSVQAELHIPEIANHVPHVNVTWDAGRAGFTPQDIVGRLRDGDPPIAVSQMKDGIRVSMWTLQDEEHKIVASRLQQVLKA